MRPDRMQAKHKQTFRRHPLAEYTTWLPTSHGVGVMQVISNASAGMRELVKSPPICLSREGKNRLKWLEYYGGHDHNASLTCRHFGIGRPTFYRWQDRYDPGHLRSLEDRSSTPKKRRMPTWSVEMVLAVKELRERYPCWGKDKLGVL